MYFVITTSIANESQTILQKNTTEEKINYLEKLSYQSFVELLPTVCFLTLVIVVGVCGNLLVFLVYLKKLKSSATRVFVLAMTVCEDTIDSNRKSDVVVQELMPLEENARIETHTWLSKDMQEKSRLVINELCKKSIFCKDTSELEVHADKHDTEACSGQNEISRCSSVPDVSGADCVMSMNLKQEMLVMSEDPGIENLSEPVANNEGGGHEDNIIDVYCHRLQTGKENQRKRGLLSRTTLLMLVLTISTVICCFPNFVVALANVQFENVHLSPWKTNIYHLARTFPSINCALNPFIYSFCNIKFRLQCRQFLTNMHNVFLRQD